MGQPMNTETPDTLARLRNHAEKVTRPTFSEMLVDRATMLALIEVCEAARAVVEHECRERGIPTPEPGFSRAATLTDWNAHEVAALAAALENLETGSTPGSEGGEPT